MNVYFLVSSFIDSGLTKVIFNVAKHLNRIQGKQVNIIELNSAGEGRYKTILEKEGVVFYDLGIRRYSLFTGAKQVNRIISGSQGTVLHAHCFRSILLLFILKTVYKCPYVSIATLHSYIPFNYRDEFGGVLGAVYSSIVVFCAKRLDCQISVSRSTAELYENNNRFRPRVIQNGVDIVDSDLGKNLDCEQLDKSSEFIVHIGSLSKRKRVQFLCESFVKYRKLNEKSNLKLVLIGGGAYADFLLEKYSKFDFIEIVGSVGSSVVFNYLRNASYFVSCSASEGLPNSVMEAMSVGLPCLLSDIPPHRELIGNDECGLLFQLDDESSFLCKLKELVGGGSNTSFADCSRERVMTTFNSERMSQKHFELYKSLLHEHVC